MPKATVVSTPQSFVYYRGNLFLTHLVKKPAPFPPLSLHHPTSMWQYVLCQGPVNNLIAPSQWISGRDTTANAKALVMDLSDASITANTGETSIPANVRQYFDSALLLQTDATTDASK